MQTRISKRKKNEQIKNRDKNQIKNEDAKNMLAIDWKQYV